MKKIALLFLFPTLLFAQGFSNIPDALVLDLIYPVSNNDFLIYDSASTAWRNKQISLSNMPDFNITSPSASDVMAYNGSDWIDSTIAAVLGYTPADVSIVSASLSLKQNNLSLGNITTSGNLSTVGGTSSSASGDVAISFSETPNFLSLTSSSASMNDIALTSISASSNQNAASLFDYLLGNFGTTPHNNLSSIQGGSSPDTYYHSDQPINTTDSPTFAGVSTPTLMTTNGNTFVFLKSDSSNVGAMKFPVMRSVGVGRDALGGVGEYNTAIGASAMYANSSGTHNTAIGYGAQYSRTTGAANTSLGSLSMQVATTGSNNVSIGYQSALSLLGGSANVAVGYQALGAATSASSNVAIGTQAGRYETSSNRLYIDNQARGSLALGRTNALIYGVFDVDPSLQTLALNAQVSSPYSISVPSASFVTQTAQSSSSPILNSFTWPTEVAASGASLTRDSNGVGHWQVITGTGGGASTSGSAPHKEIPPEVPDGIEDTFTLLATPMNKAATSVYVDGIIVPHTKWELVSLTIVFNAGSIPQTGQSIYFFYFDSGTSITNKGGLVTYGSPSSPVVVDETVGILATTEQRQLHFISSDGGAQTISGIPHISAGNEVGQEIIIRGTSDVNYIIIPDGNGVSLNGNITINSGQSVTMLWDGSVWTEISRRY